MTQYYFSELLPVLRDRAKLAGISRLGFSNVPLRRYLAEVFDRPYGEPGAFLADPTFEAVFGWSTADASMADLAGNLLTSTLTRAMDAPPNEYVRDYRFDKAQHPYRHQLEAWRILSQSSPQSLVVASGTGSGKTECFMVPILDRLVRQWEAQRARLVGVRALFLYPLNALINSQRERLRAWTHAFNGDIRFCLYNGNTPESLPARDRREHPNEVSDRDSLRASPPPILVTNATMLEYMLVRTADTPILAQSQGKLEWVVLDEAHTYVGSQAAEAALLIRRVLFAFGVTPDQVRFIATSATIGDPEGDAGKRLKRFLADVAGVSPERVHLVAGQRNVPNLGDDKPRNTRSLSELAAIEPELEASPSRYDALTQNFVAMKLRDLFAANRDRPPAVKLSSICESIFGPGARYSIGQQEEALRWLDLLSGTRVGTANGSHNSEVFLPLRAHLFHQTMSGLWACADRACPTKRASALDTDAWPFGQIFFEPRKHCDCGSPAYEVVVCTDCGTVHLVAGEFQGRLTHLQPLAALDEFELEVEPETDRPEEDTQETESADVAAAGRQRMVLIVNRSLRDVSTLGINRATRNITEPGDNVLSILAQEDDGDGLSCPACGSSSRSGGQLFQHSRLGAPFLLGNILPALLEFAPDGDRPAEHPCRGRRLLTFNDSRQGTARIAAKLQQDAERNRVRGLVYHIALQHGRIQSSAAAEELRGQLQTLEGVSASARTRDLNDLIARHRERLAALELPAPISFNELAQGIANSGRDFNYMLNHYRRQAPVEFGESGGTLQLAQMFLVREFGRRPKRLNSLETMGLVAVTYPALGKIHQVPAVITQVSNFDVQTWRDFLKVCLDFFVRGSGSLAIPREWRNWIGIPFPQRRLLPRDETNFARNQRRWPRATRNGMRIGIVRMLAYGLQADINTVHGADRVDTILDAAWDTLLTSGILQESGEGRVLPLDRMAFVPISQGWICPVTRRFLDTTLNGVTPYLPLRAVAENAECQKVDVPLYSEPFAGVTDDLERIRRGREWLANNAKVAELRDQGVWADLNDRVIELSLFFTAAEHSAQQESRTLDRYERAFKAGDLNLLSCSTTMEMGIDIGGISEVAMNNVPPHPANYLQRAGRAGRRKEARSVALTLCKSNPHDQAVFSNSRWAFDTPLPAPSVSLDSRVIVGRHVQSMLLSHFLAAELQGTGREQSKLTCGFFFLGDEPPVHRFSAWCRRSLTSKSETLSKGLVQLLRNTVLDGADLNRITDAAADTIDALARQWREEWTNLDKELQAARAVDDRSPICNALTFRVERLNGEYLLRELATRGYLPAYGFPTHIAPFDNLTRGKFLRLGQAAEQGRDDNSYRRRDLASRDLTTALREYAPGAEVVMDGLVYRSAGITLNWHIPADQQDVREVQNIRYAWRCSHCGASGSSHTFEEASHCEACGSDIAVQHVREYLEPAGFAVDFFREPSNDVTTQHFVPVEAPWIDARGDWIPLPNPALGRFRATTHGHVFHQSRGIHGAGYAICLECGRAEPMLTSDGLPPIFQQPHSKLRRSREDARHCPGSDDKWKIKQGITLGHQTWTDVAEIQLRLTNGLWLNNKTAAMTIAVALRDALAELVGTQATELGCSIKESRIEGEGRCHSILIFDRFAAGYASSVERFLPDLLTHARHRLECPAKCDSACPHCVLDFDQRFAADDLDRNVALEVLNDAWMGNLSLPNEYAYFGAGSRPEYRGLEAAIWQAMSGQQVAGVRFYIGGLAESWDIGPSPLRDIAYRLAGRGIRVELITPRHVIEALDESDRDLLASMADHTNIVIRAIDQMPRAGQGWLAAEAMSSPSTRWAFSTDNGLAFNLDWGQCNGPLIATNATAVVLSPGEAVSAASIRPYRVEKGDKEIEIHHNLDGQLSGFGARFWKFVSTQHQPTDALISEQGDKVTSLVYHDRYLFTPLAIALLLEVVVGLRCAVGSDRWAAPSINVVTTGRRYAGKSKTRNRVWSDWADTATRDQVLAATFGHVGIAAAVQIVEIQAASHGRLLDIGWSSGKRLTVRLDQGVSYWRAAHSNEPHTCVYDLDSSDVQRQAKALGALVLAIEGAHRPTQLFIKAR